MKKVIVILVVFLSVCYVQAQTDYRPGYVITLAGDTLFGQIDYRDDYTMGRICRFEFPDNAKKEFPPNEIQAYRFIDSKYYVSREFDGQCHFFEFLVKGRMNIYYLRDENGDHYYIEKEDDKMIELTYKEELVSKKDAGGLGIEKKYKIESKKHVGILFVETSDAPQLKNEITKIRKPEHQNLMKLAKDYHNAVCEEGEICTIFERQVPLFKLQGELTAGYCNLLRNKSDLEKIGWGNGQAFAGVNLDFWLPRVNENWYIKTGVDYMHESERINNISASASTIMLRIQAAYMYPKGKFRPTFAYGYTYLIQSIAASTPTESMKYTEIAPYLLPTLSVGVLTYLNPKTALTANLDIITEDLSFGNRESQIDLIHTYFFPHYWVMFGKLSVGVRYTF
ncbi:hypothetical protein AGMMS50262_06420 [Bacteroidia bacterium]|nr:hypothetical protein AGMMS50262_06420 [Bacteroidia bacterium]